MSESRVFIDEMNSIAKNCLNKYLQLSQTTFLTPCIQSTINLQQVRHRRTKHWDPKFKSLRSRKFVKIDIPNLNENVADMSKEEMKSRMKERGILPPRPWMERPFYIACTGGIFEPYVPPEGDGKMSAISKAGAKQKLEFIEKKSKSMLAIRKIKSFDEDFVTNDFTQFAQDIYINSLETLCVKDKYKLRELVTERAYPEMMHNIKDKTIHWKFLKSLEPPRVVHARCTDIITKENIFGQVTIRFHTQQLLAIYDRFGRLMHGSEILAKDVLEYIVFEKHLSNQYGVWRLHEKIIPDWMPPKQPAPMTYRVDDKPPAIEKVEEEKVLETELIQTDQKKAITSA